MFVDHRRRLMEDDPLAINFMMVVSVVRMLGMSPSVSLVAAMPLVLAAFMRERPRRCRHGHNAKGGGQGGPDCTFHLHALSFLYLRRLHASRPPWPAL